MKGYKNFDLAETSRCTHTHTHIDNLHIHTSYTCHTMPDINPYIPCIHTYTLSYNSKGILCWKSIFPFSLSELLKTIQGSKFCFFVFLKSATHNYVTCNTQSCNMLQFKLICVCTCTGRMVSLRSKWHIAFRFSHHEVYSQNDASTLNFKKHNLPHLLHK